MQTMDIKDEVFVDEYTGGLVGLSLGFAAAKDGGRSRCVVPPDCWGPMITPEFHRGYKVTRLAARYPRARPYLLDEAGRLLI